MLVEAAFQRCSVNKTFLEISQNSQENTSASLFFNKVAGLWACNVIEKETLAQVFSHEFCEISKNTFSYRTPPVAASMSAGILNTDWSEVTQNYWESICVGVYCQLIYRLEVF